MPGTTVAIEESELRLEKALELLEAKNSSDLSDFLNSLHPVELSSLINEVDKEDTQKELIRHITGLDQLSKFIEHSTDPIVEITLSLINDSRIAAIVRRLEIDDAAHVVGLLPRRKQIRILKRLNDETVIEISALLAHEDDTAGRLMTTLFISLGEDLFASQAIKEIQQKLKNEEIDPDTDISYIYVQNSNDVLTGVVSLREILTSESDVKLSEIMIRDVISVSPEDDQEDVARIIADYNFSALPVVSPENGSVLGLITVDDVLDVIAEEHAEDLLRLAGTEEDDTIGASPIVAFRSRLPWLIASWLGGVAGAMLLGKFSSTLEQVVALTFFMPVVFGMGGNVGSQSSTITVCGLATGTLGSKKIFGRLRKEASVGLFLGVTFGVLLSFAALMLYKDPNLSMIVGISICITMTCASALGSMLPVIMDKIGFDPAVASGPFVTTGTDFLSIIIYFSVASLLI